jgi:lactate dehydrogenase-like 2-hydroxyacid dehydrogenase
MCWDVLLSRNPLVRKYHGSPTVGVATFLQTAKSWKWQVRTCNENVLLSKPTSFLINTARGPIVDEAALVETLTDRKIAWAALDVFEHEPLPAEHPFRRLPNVLATPHIGFGSRSLYEIFFGDAVANITAWVLRDTN